MKTVRGYAVCDGCKHSQLHYCNKFNEPCPGVMFGTKKYQLICSSCSINDSYSFGNSDLSNKSSSIEACFHVPGLSHFNLFKTLLIMREHYPEAFYENRKITEIYGSFPGAIWNGRTPDFGGVTYSIQQIDAIRQQAEDLGVSINLTWNNHLVSGTDVYDRFCNAITKVFHNGKHSITVGSLELLHYLKEKYPNFKYYQSVIITTDDDVFTKKDENFDMYLMNRNLNNNWEELLKIPEKERHTIEFLCNDGCTMVCNRMCHYNVGNECLLNRDDESYFLRNYCTIDHDFMSYNTSLLPVTIGPEHIDKYLEHGFCHFKLSSRNDDDPILALKMAKYLAKPQYVDDVFAWGVLKMTTTEEQRKSSLKY